MAPILTRFRDAIAHALVDVPGRIDAIISTNGNGNNRNLSMRERADSLLAKSVSGRRDPVINWEVIKSLTPELEAIFDDVDSFKQFQRPWNELCNEYANGGELEVMINREVIREQYNTAATNNNGADTTGNNNGTNPMSANQRAMSQNNAETDQSRPRPRQPERAEPASEIDATKKELEVAKRRVYVLEAEKVETNAKLDATKKELEDGKNRVQGLEAEMVETNSEVAATKKELENMKRRVEGLVSAATASNASQQIGSTAAPVVPTNHIHLGQQAQARDDNDEGRMEAEELADAKDDDNLDEGTVWDDSNRKDWDDLGLDNKELLLDQKRVSES